MPALPVTVFSGFLGAGKTTVLKHILSSRSRETRFALIVNDMSEIQLDSRLLSEGQVHMLQKEEKLVEMQNGCICCTLREDLLHEVRRLAELNQFDHLLIESTGVSEPLPVAETFFFANEEYGQLNKVAPLKNMTTVVDGLTLEQHLQDADALKDLKMEVDEGDERSLTDLLVEQIEFANVILVNKSDTLMTEDRQRIGAILRSLNADAEIEFISHGQVDIDWLLKPHRFDMNRASQASAWMKVLLGEETPETEEYGIQHLSFRARKPFHPTRLKEFIDQEAHWETLLRAKGIFWISSNPGVAAELSLAGGQLRIGPKGHWFADLDPSEWNLDPDQMDRLSSIWDPQFGDRSQELVFIGQNLDTRALKTHLNNLLLTDEELKKGNEYWASMQNPFGQWELDTPADL